MTDWKNAWNHRLGFAARLSAGSALAVYLVIGYPPLIDSYSFGNDFQVLRELTWTHAIAFPLAVGLLGGILRDMVRDPSAKFLLFRFGEPSVTGDPDLLEALNYQNIPWSSSFSWKYVYLREVEAFRLKHDTGHIDLIFGDG